MAKIASAPIPIPMKMFRHFAIITVVITALIALFASGENRQAIAEEVEQREREAELQRISAERTAGPRIGRRDENAQSRFAGGDMQDFGRPMVNLPGGSNSSTLANFSSGGAARRGETMQIPGYTQAYLNSLSEEEYRRLVQNLRASGMLDPEQRAQNLAGLEAASRQRSGKAASAEDLER